MRLKEAAPGDVHVRVRSLDSEKRPVEGGQSIRHPERFGDREPFFFVHRAEIAALPLDTRSNARSTTWRNGARSFPTGV
jgi:hypothetical protein